MEKAKLILTISKNNQITATLQFTNGKTMPLQQHNLRDIALNGSEVEVERQGGRVVLVKSQGKTLYPTQSPQQSPQSKPGLKRETSPKLAPQEKRLPAHSPEPPSKQERSSGDKQQPFEHISHVRNPAYAPYNFIPLNREVVEINPTIPPANKYDPQRSTGWIDLDIEAITPLYIRGTLTQEEVAAGMDSKDKPEFYAPVDKLRIPGSSLRGLTRNMVEMISFGKFHFFEDRRLYYRGLADRSNLREEYQSWMSSYDRRARRTQYNFSVGLLRKSDKKEPGLHFEIKSSGGNFKQIYKDEAQEMVQALGAKYAEFNFYRVDEGYLVVSGDMPNKKRDWLISEPPDNAEIIEIPLEDVRSYNDDRTRDDRVPNLLKLARQKENEKGVPCFYVRWQEASGRDRVSFGHTGMFRLAYEKTIGEHIPAPLQDETKIDFAEAIFGNEKTHNGRVFFEDAFMVGEQNDAQLEAQTPKILSTPKPTAFQHYLVQNSDEVKQLNSYNSDTAVRGYKIYWHKSGERWVETERKAKDTQYTQFKPVKAGTKFRGRIRFENLADKELGAMLYALDLPAGCGHKLGMGKPLGLGSIRITPKLYLSKRDERYKDFFAEWDNKIDASDYETLKKFKNEFSGYVLHKLGQDSSKLLWETDRLRELLVMLRYDAGRELEQTGANRYMSIAPQNEFKNRYVLPEASRVVPASKVEEALTQLRSEPKPHFKKEIGDELEAVPEERGEPQVDKGKVTHIKKVEITGLWDKFNINWSVDEKVSILVGINGSGKSTILELIMHALADEYENPQNVKYPPQELTIIFDNDERLSYGRSESGIKRVARSHSRLLPEFVSTFDAPLELEGTEKDKEETTKAQIEKQLTSKLWERIDRFFDELKAVSLVAMDPAPYIDNFVQLVNEEVFNQAKKKIGFVGEIKFTNAWLHRFLEENDVSTELREKLKAMVNDETHKLDREFPELLESKIGENNASRLRSHILKRVEFVEKSTPSQAVFRLDDGRILMPDQLSTGEKQMLIILFTALILKLRALVSDDRRYVLIMDEPENSLHLKWQKFLISYVRRLNESVQIIIATHAPAIIKKGYMEKTVEMNQIKSLMGA